MKDQERQELFEALSGYYPYGALTEHNGEVYPVYNVYNDGSFIVGNEHSRTSGEIDKMYLRPMSSMTEEERMEFAKLFSKWHDDELFDYIEEGVDFSIWKHKGMSPVVFYWLNSHHFDYLGLIPRGLALVAKENMYK